jgi:uncharacterized protein (TIGR03067 family)
MYATLILALTLAAPNLKDRAGKPDLVGEWVVESTTVNGATRAPPGDELTYTFTKEGQWIIRRGGKESVSPNRAYTVEPDARPPRIEMMTDKTRADLTGRSGIYKVEGDTATICVAPAQQPRPTAFESTIENRHVIYVLKRKKKD